jgi:membrane protease YdiL (CAAX protease family)
VGGPVRLAVDASGFDLLVILCAAYVAEVAGNLLVLHHTHLGQALEELTAGAVGKTFSILTILLPVMFKRVLGIRAIGLPIGRAGSGIAAGAATLFILFPLIQISSAIVVFIYRHFHLEQADLHPVLQIIGNTHSRWVGVLGIILAVILAPVSEELFYRGLLQTALGRLFYWMDSLLNHLPKDSADLALAYPADPGAGASKILNYFGKPTTAPPRNRTRWMAILVTAALFAVVHGEVAFLAPLFILAVGLGYAYERTGNLWVSITAHSLFNAAQILLYLAMK